MSVCVCVCVRHRKTESDHRLSKKFIRDAGRAGEYKESNQTRKSNVCFFRFLKCGQKFGRYYVCHTEIPLTQTSSGQA